MPCLAAEELGFKFLRTVHAALEPGYETGPVSSGGGQTVSQGVAKREAVVRCSAVWCIHFLRGPKRDQASQVALVWVLRWQMDALC